LVVLLFFVSNTIENRYYGLIKEALDQITKKKNDLVFIIKESKKKKIKKLKKNHFLEQRIRKKAKK